jgi:hypothetical protein
MPRGGLQHEGTPVHVWAFATGGEHRGVGLSLVRLDRFSFSLAPIAWRTQHPILSVNEVVASLRRRIDFSIACASTGL